MDGQGWRQALYSYVNHYNRVQVGEGPVREDGVITDLGLLYQRGELRSRLAEWYRERGAVPLRSETRASQLRVVTSLPEETVVDVRLQLRVFYVKGGMTHREDRIEQERLTFIRDGRYWIISRVERDSAEGRSEAEATFPESADGQGSIVRPDNPPFLNQEVLGASGGGRPIRYRREEAVAYADRWWDSYNPEFEAFDVDCTNYVSQCLFAGGAPIHYTGKRESGWWYKGRSSGKELWSFSWAVSNALERYLGASGRSFDAVPVERPEQLMLGDVISYDWDGDGTFQHSAIVTAFDAGGMPLVNAHTVSARHRYWDYRDSYAWTDRTVYRFYHIADHL
ncbi:amidase domain-containing protein [Paenibacillus sp. FSL K6-1230]|uniref:amidase domain-containing protein n=1 Tax=Paenibacillus sp. FSL K6-1230 TaxID=2921603 RepID=UPI0030FA5EE5